MQFYSLIIALIISTSCLSHCFAQVEIEAALKLTRSYTKQEARIEMRDGVTLYTTIYSPTDTGPKQRYPILLQRTPYGCWPYGSDHRQPIMYNPRMVEQGYIFVYQDLRSRSMSDGAPEFENLKPAYSLIDPDATDEITDAEDTLDWLIANVQHHNGRVGLFGNSYMGWTALMAAASQHSSIKATLAAGPCIDGYFEDFTRNGLFCLAYTPILDWFGTPKNGRHPGPWWKNELDYWADGKRFGLAKDSYQYFLDLGPLKNLDRIVPEENYFLRFLREHPNYDAARQARNTLPVLKRIASPTLIVGGWNDEQNLYGILRSYSTLRDKAAPEQLRFVMGPWSHGQHREKEEFCRVGNIHYGAGINTEYQAWEAAWFKHQLKPEAAQEPGPFANGNAKVFDTGTKSWKQYQSYPPASARKLTKWYLSEGFRLTTDHEHSIESESDVQTESGNRKPFEFLSDPAKPVPYIESDEFNLFPAKHFMTDDQRFASKRPDVLTFISAPIQNPITVMGPLRAKLLFSTDQSDADLIVKLIDVLPLNREPQEQDQSGIKMNGYQQLVRMGQIRCRYRKGYETPSPMVPHEAEWIEVDLLDVHHTFGTGHRVMLQIQSSCFPLFDRNPQKFVPNIFEADDADFTKATHKIFEGSHIQLRAMAN